ncbi:MAG: hypothetical protein AB7O97_19470 [Planctomycetota bacterium]
MIQTPTLLALLAAAGLAGAAARAQDNLPDPRSLIPLDRVVATVNDAVILESEVKTLTLGEIRSRERELGRQLTPEERGLLFLQRLGVQIDQHALAQAAKTLGIIPPDRVEQIYQDQLLQEERELERELGGMQRVADERARQGRTWQTFEREQRVNKMAQLTREMAVSLRLQNQRNLFITPRMMREFYRRNRDQFVHGGLALLGCVAFLGKDAPAVATRAAEVWRTEGLSPEELARRFEDQGAFAPELLRIDEAARKTRRADQVDFALAGPEGRVSEPLIETDSTGGTTRVRLWKVIDHVAERADAFDDPEVQSVIREHMEQQVLNQLLDQVLRRCRERTKVWRPPDLR